MNESTRGQSPIFNKTYDFILWLLEHTEKFPKSERFRLARRMEDSAFEFYELIIQAARKKDGYPSLAMADLQLDKLRLYIRMAQARHLTSLRQYRYAAGALVEIGKLLGGWMKASSKS